ncbi:MAG TPA: cupin domain-containing protein [Candidatus Binataceae bacterium]|nr:cupin domain-containing protein [Candidatus Solibacter sp.]HKF30076.1 cupin domain-containing protein [Candidatus Binataceae bacterium]
MRWQITTNALAALVLVALGLSTVVAQAPPGASAGVVHELMRQPLADQRGTDVVVITVDYPPGGVTPPHEHPGYTYAYVLEGTVVSQLDDQPQQTFSAGQMWSELPHQHHMVSRNGSATAPAKLLVFFITPHGEQLTQFLPAK